jgi:hypothetical protein
MEASLKSKYDLCFSDGKKLFILVNIFPLLPLESIGVDSSIYKKCAYIQIIGKLDKGNISKLQNTLKDLSKKKGISYFFTYANCRNSLLENIGFENTTEIFKMVVPTKLFNNKVPSKIKTNKIKFKRATFNDVKRANLIVKNEMPKWYNRLFFEFFLCPGGFFVAKKGDEICGFATMRLFNGKKSKWGYGVYTFVKEKFRRKDLARILERLYSDYAYKKHVKFIYTHAPYCALLFNIKTGWKILKEEKIFILKI